VRQQYKEQRTKDQERFKKLEDEVYGKTIIDCKGGPQAKVQGASLHALQTLRAAAGLSAQV